MQKIDVEHVETPPLCVEQKNAQKEGHVVKRNYCWGYVVLHIHTAADCAVGLCVKLATCRSLFSVLALHPNVVEMLVENILRDILG